MDSLINLGTERRVTDREIARNMLRDLDIGRVRDFDLLADAYAYEMPPAESSLRRLSRNRFDWVASATVGPEDDRYYLRYVKSNGKMLTASNGVRIHGALDKRPPGYYMVHTQQLLCPLKALKYPSFAGHFVAAGHWHRVDELRFKAVQRDTGKTQWVTVDVPGSSHFPAIEVDKHELEQALAGFEDDDNVATISGSLYSTPQIELVAKEKLALVMGTISEQP